MRHRINISTAIVAVAFLAWGLTSCTKEIEDIANSKTSSPREMVPISLNLTVQDLLDATSTGTKGVKPDTLTHQESSAIKNLWILQYDGTGEGDSLLFYHYYNDYASIVGEAINVIASGTDSHSLFFIANTFDSTIAFGSAKTIAQARMKSMKVINEGKVVHTEVVAGDTIHYPMMNGVVTCPISTGTVSCALERSVARVDCNVKCNVSGMTVQDITLCSVPNQVYCLTKDYVSGLSTFPSETGLYTTDYAPTPWSKGVQKTGDAATRQFSFYVPCNKRGSSGNSNPKLKSASAPSGATYARITASFILGGITRYATYTFYLGANLTNDFNLLPNHKYTYTFTIDKIGDQDTDYRVSLDYVDYTKKDPENCYMLKPPTEGTWRSYMIPIERVYDFWHDYAGDQLRSLELSNCPGWEMQIIWSDTQLTIANENQSRGDVVGCNFKWKKASKKFLNGLGEKVDVMNDFFEFEIPSTVNNTNILIGIKRYSNDACTELDEGYLWSWHMWITDYEPNKCEGFSPQVDADGNETRFVYSVPGGAVHRYLGDLWNNNQAAAKTGVYKGIYKGKFIMDRNLGARQVNVYTAGDELHYQFGRKDPFCNSRTQYNVGETRRNIASDKTTGANNNVDYSVVWPNAFITGGDWTNGATTSVTGISTSYNQTTPAIYWQDPRATADSLKSIFDPCPAGWRVPFNGTWNDFDVTASTRFKWGDPIASGRTYLPTGITGTIYYPASGFLNSVSGGSTYVGSFGRYWSCSPSVASNGWNLYFISAYVLPSYGNERALGFSVRCVQE